MKLSEAMIKDNGLIFSGCTYLSKDKLGLVWLGCALGNVFVTNFGYPKESQTGIQYLEFDRNIHNIYPELSDIVEWVCTNGKFLPRTMTLYSFIENVSFTAKSFKAVSEVIKKMGY